MNYFFYLYASKDSETHLQFYKVKFYIPANSALYLQIDLIVLSS